jgi:hypothetical protein
LNIPNWVLLKAFKSEEVMAEIFDELSEAMRAVLNPFKNCCVVKLEI